MHVKPGEGGNTMATGSQVAQARPWEVLRDRLRGQGQRLEAEAAAACDAGDDETANRLAGERDAHYHLADALEELRDVAAVLDGLPALVDLAQCQAEHAEARADRLQARPERSGPSIRAYRGLVTYWESLVGAYGDVADLLRSGQAAGQAKGTDR